MTDEERAALTRIVRDHEEGRLLLWINDDVVQAIAAALAEVDYCHALLADLRQDSAAYQRGLEDGIKQERERCIEADVYDGGLANGAERCRLAVERGRPEPSCLVCGGFEHIQCATGVRRPCPACRPGTPSAGTPSPAPVE